MVKTCVFQSGIGCGYKEKLTPNICVPCLINSLLKVTNCLVVNCLTSEKKIRIKDACHYYEHLLEARGLGIAINGALKKFYLKGKEEKGIAVFGFEDMIKQMGGDPNAYTR